MQIIITDQKKTASIEMSVNLIRKVLMQRNLSYDIQV